MTNDFSNYQYFATKLSYILQNIDIFLILWQHWATILWIKIQSLHLEL